MTNSLVVWKLFVKVSRVPDRKKVPEGGGGERGPF